MVIILGLGPEKKFENSIPKLHKKIDTILAPGLDILKMIPENLPIVI